MDPGVSTKVLRGAIFAASARTGRRPAELAAVVGLVPGLVTDPDARIPHSVAVRAWEQLAALADDPHLGLFAATLLDAAPMDMVDLALNNARDLRGLIDAFDRFQRLFHDANDCVSVREGDRALGVFRLRPEAPRCRHLVEFVLGTWVCKQRRLLGDRFELLEVRFQDPLPVEPTVFAHAFGGAPVRFGCEVDAIVQPASLLDAPLVGASPARWELLEKQLETLLAARLPEAAFAGEARRRLRVELTRGKAEADALAKALGMSKRSLQRKLAESGTSFSDLLDGVRKDLAVVHLEHPDASVTEVAFLLGFADLTSFSRAFRRWTGRTPAEHRRAARRSVPEAGGSS